MILQDYDRTPDKDMNEDINEEKINNLDIHVKEIEVKTLLRMDFVDYHKILDHLEDEEEPCCDFGIFALVESSFSEADLATGDIIISVDEQDFLDCTSAQLKTHLLKINRRCNKSKVTIVYGKSYLDVL